jgi:hypothetical protein
MFYLAPLKYNLQRHIDNNISTVRVDNDKIYSLIIDLIRKCNVQELLIDLDPPESPKR